MSFGTQALFKWKGKSCSDSEAGSCCLGHGDILVMDGPCQNEILHCTDPGLEQARINVTFCWTCALRTGGMLPATVCAGFIRFCFGFVGEWWFLGLLCTPWSLPACVQGSGYAGVPSAGHAHWAEVGGGIIFVTLSELAGQHKKLRVIHLGEK